MSILRNFPMVSQRTGVTSDGKPSNNYLMDCVPSAIGAAILWYQGKTQWDSTINPDMLKDAAYNEAYTGGTAAAAYVGVCAKLGYTLTPVSGSSAQLVALAHRYIDAGIPVVYTEPDPYVSASLDWSHVCVFYASGPGNLTALDPWIAQPIQYTDTKWATLLEFNQIWIVEPTEALNMLQPTDPMGKFFEVKSDTCWHCTETAVDLAFDHLTFYRRYEGIFGLPLTGEIYLSSLKGTAIVVYERAIAIYDPAPRKATHEAPPGASSTYLLHIDSGIGQQLIAKPLIMELDAHIIKLQAEVDAAPASVAQIAELQTRITSYEAALKQISAIVAQSEGKAA